VEIERTYFFTLQACGFAARGLDRAKSRGRERRGPLFIFCSDVKFEHALIVSAVVGVRHFLIGFIAALRT
jgi:hypothetical protein